MDDLDPDPSPAELRFRHIQSYSEISVDLLASVLCTASEWAIYLAD